MSVGFSLLSSEAAFPWALSLACGMVLLDDDDVGVSVGVEFVIGGRQ